MTREEAIKILSKDTSLATVNELKYYSGFNQEKVVGLIQEAMDMGAKALEKQIPKKPIEKESDFMGHLYCPNCDQFFDCDEEYYLKYGEWNHCGKCGQAIDWSRDELS